MGGTTVKAGLVVLAAVLSAAGATAPASAAGRSAGAEQCRQGGWQQQLTSGGQDFASPGRCTRHAVQGGIFRTNPFPAAKQACDELHRSSFSVFDTRYYTAWTCTWRAAEIAPQVHDLLERTCLAAGGEYGGEHLPSPPGTVSFRCLDFP